MKGTARVEVSSLTVRLAMLEMVGASFTAVTVRTNSSKAVAVPSLTVMRMVVVPDWLAAGVRVTVRLAPVPPRTMLATGTRAVLDDVLVSVRLPAAVSTSPTVKGTAGVGVSSLTVRLAMLEMVGTSFTGVTVRTNSSKALAAPSLTVMRTVVVPDWFGGGVRVTVRLAPEPPKTMLATGTRAVFDDVRVSVRLPVASRRRRR